MGRQIDIPWRGAELRTTLLQFQEVLDQRIDADASIPCMPVEPRFAEVAERDAAIPGGIPPELQQLYAEIEGFEVSDTDPWLYPLEKLQWDDRQTREADSVFRQLAKINSPWANARYFAFGQNSSGDWLTYCVNAPHRRDGLIVTLDHEGQGPEENPEQPCVIVVVADTLAEWLDRWMEFDLIEYSWCTGGIHDLEPDRRRLFLTDHVRLNPGMRDWQQHLLDLRSA